MSDIDIEYLKQWEGREQIDDDPINPRTARAIAAVLDWQATPEAGAELSIREVQNPVYREDPKPDAPPAPAGFSRGMTADPVLLFRFSALTFNSHRMHYGRDYATAMLAGGS